MEEDNDLLAGALAGWANSASCGSYRESGCLNVGELITLLEGIAESKTISFLDGSHLGDLDSYRGTYSELAIGFSEGTPTSQETVGEFLARLKDKIGKTIYGYKGGEYTVTEKTTVHKANHGKCGDVIVGLREHELSVDILSRDEDDDPFEEEGDIKSKLKEAKSKPKEKYKVAFVSPDGATIGSTKIKQSEKDEHAEPACEIESFGAPAWTRLKCDNKVTAKYSNLIECVDLVRAINDRKESVEDKDYELSTTDFVSEFNNMERLVSKLWDAYIKMAEPDNFELEILSKELKLYLRAFVCTTYQLWDRFGKIKNTTKNDVKDFYVFLDNVDVDEVAKLVEDRMLDLWKKGEL